MWCLGPSAPRFVFRLSTGRARGPWPEDRTGPALWVRRSRSETGGPAPNNEGQGQLELALAL